MGFSSMGLAIVSLIFAPNLLYVKYPPKDIPKGLKDVNMFFTLLERVGQTAFFIILVLSKNNYKNTKANIWFILMVISIIVYYALWIRYVIKGKYFSLLFKPIWIIPIPMAIFPVLAFGFAALLGKSVYLGITVIIFAIGHFVNSWNSYLRTK
jgi:hypothetical protein